MNVVCLLRSLSETKFSWVCVVARRRIYLSILFFFLSFSVATACTAVEESENTKTRSTRRRRRRKQQHHSFSLDSNQSEQTKRKGKIEEIALATGAHPSMYGDVDSLEVDIGSFQILLWSSLVISSCTGDAASQPASELFVCLVFFTFSFSTREASQAGLPPAGRQLGTLARTLSYFLIFS